MYEERRAVPPPVMIFLSQLLETIFSFPEKKWKKISFQTDLVHMNKLMHSPPPPIRPHNFHSNNYNKASLLKQSSFIAYVSAVYESDVLYLLQWNIMTLLQLAHFNENYVCDFEFDFSVRNFVFDFWILSILALWVS